MANESSANQRVQKRGDVKVGFVQRYTEVV